MRAPLPYLLVPCLLPVACLLLLGLLGGCSMQRSVTIDSDPTGAAIWVNGVKQPGTTPVTIPFSHYGRFDVRVEKPGYQSVASDVMVATQIDGYPIIDLPFDVIGGKRSFRRIVKMEPLGLAADAQGLKDAIGRARDLRERTHREVVEPDTPGRQAPELLK
jgi:hypothetical protein